MRRKILPALAAGTLLLAACGGEAPALTDPKEIVTQGLEATAELTSVHLLLEVDGTASIPDLGGEMNLSGTRLEGDVDLANEEGHLTFAVPPMFGLEGEVIQIGRETYTKTSMTGELWSKSEVSEEDPMAGAMDPSEQLGQVRAFLDEEGVVLEKLDDTDCGDRTCYRVRLTVPGDVIADAAEGAEVDPSEIIGEELVLDLLFDREEMWLSEVSTDITAESVGELSLRLTLSAFNEPVDVQAPPADEVTEGAPGLPF